MQFTNSLIFLTLLVFYSSVYSTKMKSELYLESKTFLKEVITESAAGAFCFLNSNGTVYDLRPMNNIEKDYTILQGNSSQIHFNMCKNAHQKCGKNSGMVIWSSIQDSKNCKTLAGEETVVSNWAILSDTESNKTTLQVQLPPGDECKTNSTLNYQTTFMLECDLKATKPVILTNKINIDQCSNIILIKSAYACPLLNVYSFWNSIVSNKYLIGTMIMIAGFFVCIFGIKFIHLTEIAIGIIATSFVLMFFLFSYLKVQYSGLEFWTIVIISILIGIIVGYFVSKMKKIPAVILGVCCGYLLSIFLYQFFLKFINSNPYVVFWTTAVTLAAVFGVCAWFFYEHVIIVGTSFTGAYAIIRGISLMVGGFPDERQVMDLINLKEWEQLKNLFTFQVYLYLTAIVGLGIIGAYIQYKFFYQSEDGKSNIDEETKDQIDKSFKDSEAKQPLINKIDK